MARSNRTAVGADVAISSELIQLQHKVITPPGADIGGADGGGPRV